MANSQIKTLSRVKEFIKIESHDIYTILFLIIGVGILSLATPIAIQALVNIVTMGAVMEPLYVVSIILFVLLTLSGTLYVLQFYLAEQIQRRFFVRTAIEAVDKTQTSTSQEHNAQNTAELMNRFLDVMTVQKASAVLLTSGLTSVLQALIGSLVLMFYSVYFALIVILMLAAMWFILCVVGRNGINTAIQESVLKYQIVAWLEAIAHNINAFKFLQGRHLSHNRIDNLTLNYLKVREAHFKILFRQNLMGVILYASAGTVMLALGGTLVINGQINLGQFVAAELIIFNVLSSFSRFIYHLESFYGMVAAFDKIGMIQDLPQEQGGSHSGDQHQIEISVKDVRYDYPNQEAVINKLSFDIPAKVTMAFLAKTGSGKSTIAELLVGLKTPNAGSIQYNQIDIKQFDIEALRQKVGYIQKQEILEDSIANNVRFGRPNISVAHITEALTKVGLLETVLKFEKNIDTKLSHDGMPLSTVQSKLVSLARTVISSPALLVIDDLLDDFDKPTLDFVMQLLCAKDRSWSLVVFTKHADVANYCDKVMELNSTDHWELQK